MPTAKPRGRKKATAKKKPVRSNARVKKYRDKMRAAGLRPVQIWAYDTKDPAFLAQAKRECDLINQSADSHKVLEEMLSISDFSDWK